MNLYLKSFFKNNFLIFISCIILSSFGLSTIYNFTGDNSLFYKQLVIILIGFSSMIALSFLDFSFLKNKNYVFIFYIFTLIVLSVLLFFGYVNNGSQSWFRIAGISFQPAEFAKLALILMLAKYLHKRHVDIAYFNHVLISGLYTLIATALVLKQPDLGSALVIVGIWTVLVFVSGISKKHIFIIFLFAIATIFFAWKFVFANYQKERILNFVDPLRDVRGSGYNVFQSIIAVGSGGFSGKGVSLGTQSKLSFLPEYQTDFIFAGFAEEWGFIGVCMLVFLFLLLIFSLCILATRAPDNFEMLFIMGVAAYFIIHFCVNVGMNMGILPVTGIPLPFVSAGGTHLLLESIMLGIVFSMSKNSLKNHKKSNFVL